jgi:DNA-binding transcriptional MerR regulator
MKIGELAAATGLTVDTLRYYEKLRVLDPPRRLANGYRRYGAQHLERIRFVQSAKALGFSLAEIVTFIPRLSAGKMGRAELEAELHEKLREVRAEIAKLGALERNLTKTLSALSCAYDAPLSSEEATAHQAGEPVHVRTLKRAAAG